MLLLNKSKIIPKDLVVFECGSKADENSKGFGYGLYWIKTLENSYNNIIEYTNETIFKITHNEMNENKGFAFQKFIIDNIKID